MDDFTESARKFLAHQERRRLHGACIAMSRFMAFVWMEASWHQSRITLCRITRSEALFRAINRGMFRLEFKR